MLTRRKLMATGIAATSGAMLIRPFAAMAQNLTGDSYDTDSGQVSIHPVSHASFVMDTPAGRIYVDPVGGAAAYEALPAADAILITHHHGDHFDPETLAGLVERAGSVPMITNPTVAESLPAELQGSNTVMANGDSATLLGYDIRAVPAYNYTEDRQGYHPEGRDNGYVISVDGLTVYVAGDTEDTPEMRALEGIDLAFVPFNLPYTMTEEQAAAGVTAFAPKVVYPYHYRGSDLDLFESLLAESGAATEVMRGDWYTA
ncbi:MAG: MBL fold metallo-hydrolase [Rhodobacteraceae bacterium]|nr:MBL fold metallo-hydrolase [Paracoccaceae bacterium]MBR9820464.1 MBL fold metallo-hydrolase [Paracoccaceae bacterium]